MLRAILLGLATTMIVGLAAWPAAAQDRHQGCGRDGERLKQADTNGDQQLTWEEVQAAFPEMTEERFERMDRNGDGVLTKDDRPERGERGAERKGRLLEKLKEADTDGDKQLTWEEAQAAFPEMTEERFERMDRNGDGVISMDDRPDRGQGRQGDRGQGRLIEKLKEADTDGDQQLTFEEAQAAFPKITKERFDKMDHNGDGVLSRDDRPQDAAE